ncbi:MAG: ATP-binding protein [Bacteroidales bacterium]|nr:ATP-binding protein [Bacteroidales bacterium]
MADQVLIGRKEEQEILQRCVDSEKAEFVAVFGRRRIGKTYLVKRFFKDNFDFYITGIYECSKKEQLSNFQRQLRNYSGKKFKKPTDWFEAFDQLRQYLSNLTKERKIVFLDELPWLDTPKSNFTRALELFWNEWASDQPDLKLIVCGSATTWMTNKLLGDKGGLHNRVTQSIHLAPFTLKETEEYLLSKGIVWNRYQIVECYMILGGTPYYQSKLQKDLSLSQNIDNIFFSKNAELREEYSFLFRSLFKNSTIYQRVVELLSKETRGLTRKEICDKLKIEMSGNMTECLENLCNCDFLRKYNSFGNRKRDVTYQLIDMYTLFYLHHIKPNSLPDEHYWSNTFYTPAHTAWSGFAYELVCMNHIPQIKDALGIRSVQTNVYSWRSTDENEGGQIDLVIDRKDQIINLCEIKYSTSEYELTKDYMQRIQERRESFRKQTRTSKALHLTFITTYGLKKNAFYGMIQSSIDMESLFD